MSKWSKTDQPCPCGDSSDAFAYDRKGGGFCYSCNKPFHPNQLNPQEEEIEIEETEGDEEYVVEELYKSYRGISKRTAEFYNIKTTVVNGEDYGRTFVYPNAAEKTKKNNPKNRGDKYKWKGQANAAGLFGRDLFERGSKSSVTITEGEDDAPSLYEALGGSSACVSVQSSSTALRDIENERDWINSFDKIILAFDNDEAGKEATRRVMSSGLFDFNKLYWVPFESYKDANDYLQAGAYAELTAVWKAAKKYTPDNIISTFSEIKSALKQSRDEEIGTYPTEKLNDLLYGLYRGQVVCIKGLEGIGKTEIFRMMEYHLLKTTECKIGMIHMEEDKATTIRGLATYELDIPCNLPDSGIGEEDIVEGYSKAVGNREDRVFIYTMFGGDDPDDVLDSIRFLVASGGVDIIFLDHITLLATGQEEGDERRKLDYISTKLKKMAQELKFCLVMISHVNDEGQTRGSRNISKIADIMIQLDRDKLADDEFEKNSLYLTVEKNRKTGRTGKAGTLYFNTETFKLEELSL